MGTYDQTAFALQAVAERAAELGEAILVVDWDRHPSWLRDRTEHAHDLRGTCRKRRSGPQCLRPTR